MARGHVEWMQQAGFHVVAGCDVSPERRAALNHDFPEVQVFETLDSMISDAEFGLCTVVLPHNLHAPVAIQLSSAKRAVIVEKPMCISSAEADRMIDAARAHGVMLSVFQNRRWDGDFQTIHGLITSGEIGDPYSFEVCMGDFGGLGHTWRAYKDSSGGGMFDWGAHIVDWLLQMVPSKVDSVLGFHRHLAEHPETNEDHSHMIIRFESDAIADIQIGHLDAAPRNRWRILGTQGAIVQKSWGDIEVSVEHHGHVAKYEVHPPHSKWLSYYENVREHLTNGADLAVKPEESRRAISAIEASYRSEHSRKPEEPAYA